MGWIARGLLILGGVVASWFIARDEHIFPVVSFVAAMLMFTAFVAAVAFWPTIRGWVKTIMEKNRAE